MSKNKKYQSKKLTLTLKKNEILLDNLRKRGTKLLSMCGGHGICGKCIVRIYSSEKLTPTTTEKKLLSKSDLASGYRLACLVKTLKRTRLKIEIPPESEETQQRLVVSGFMPKISIQPTIKKVYLEIKPPTLNDPKSDLQRLTSALEKICRFRITDINYNSLKELATVLRYDDWKVTVSIFKNREIVRIESGDTSKSCYGFSVDIGTTKLAGYLINLLNGQTVSTVSNLNPQSKFGEDIIARITFTMKDIKSMAEINRCIIEGINSLIKEACNNAGISSNEILDVSVAGNTAMHHIFLGISPRYLSLAPYPPVLSRGFEVRALDLGLNTNIGSRVYLLPVVAGFVGGDAVADVIATGIHSANDLSMLIDIGTNAEIILGTKKKLVSCSCASGPAFEGSHIRHGMRASKGAIERIWIDPRSFDVSFKVIGNTKPVGICGSAVVEGIAEMLRTGIIDSRGRMNQNNKSIRKKNVSLEFLIADRSDSGINDDIVITQSDIREIQLAKAAVYTGISILMKHMRVKPKEIKKFYLAGAFGTYIDPTSAIDLGMFPEIPLERIQFVGNTAGSGARMTLISNPTRKLVERIIKKIDYIELGANPNFQKEFISSMDLPNVNKKLFPTIMKTINRNLLLREQNKNT
ncbi:ASKHA domain-containing protein [[Eubacterium] cellulosolvens]